VKRLYNHKADTDLKTRGEFFASIRACLARVFKPITFAVKFPKYS
jgi:hypothetical protein